MSMYSLFNSADDCLSYSLPEYPGQPRRGLTEPMFSESLLLNVLFQEGLLLHEAYFFNSTLLAKHLASARSGKSSLFEVASRRGLIIPAFRDPLTETLDQAYDAMKAVYGDSYQLLHPEVQPFRDRIVASVDIGLKETGTKPFYWPTRKGPVGEGYQKTILDLLQTEQPPELPSEDPDRQQLIQRVWEASKRWRFDNVNEAIRRTREKGALGLQRMELMCSLGWSVGIPKDVVTIGTQDIIESCSDPEQRLTMEIFLNWITQCHHLNLADHLGTAANFPVYNYHEDFILDTVLRSRLDMPTAPFESFRCQAEFPPIDALLTADATELIAIQRDIGVGYLHALRRWQDNPTIDNQEAVKGSFHQYCGQICARYDTGIRQTLMVQGSQRTSSRNDMVTTVAGVAQAVTGIPFGTFLQITRTTRNQYRYFRRKAVTRDFEIALPNFN